MQPEMIERYLKDPIVIGIIVAVILFVILIFLFLRSRKRKDVREAGIRSELASMERETQFAQAAGQIQYLKNPEDVVRDIAQMFRDFLSMPVVAVYAGRDDDPVISKLPLQRQTGSLGLQASDLPESLQKSQVQQYWQPQMASADLFTNLPERGGPSGQESSAGAAGAAGPERGIIVFPWRGAFGWAGVVLAEPGELKDSDDLERLSEPVAQLGNRLAVSLELGERERALSSLSERSARSAEFFRSLVAGTHEPSPFSAVARELAKFMGADSAALWMTEPGSSMIRMVAAHGLRSAEFLPLPAGQGLAGNVVEHGEPLALEDAPSDPRCLFPREARESGVISYLGVPVRVDGATGVVEIHTSSPRAWGESDVRELQAAAAVIGEVLKTSDTRGGGLRVESSYLGLSEAMQRLRSPGEVMDATVEVLGHALGVSRALVVEFDERGQAAPVTHEYLAPNAPSAKGVTFPEDLFRRVSAESVDGAPIILSDSRSESLAGPELADRLQVLSELAVPFEVGGRLRGVVYLNQCDRMREWDSEGAEFADRVARQLALSLSNAQAIEEAAGARDAAVEEARKAGEAAGRAQGVINALPEAVLGLDKEGRLTFFNQTARERLGLKQEDLGHVVEMMESLAMSDEDVWDTVIASRSATRLESRLAAGQRVSVAVAPVRNSRGEFSGQLVVISQIDHVAAAGEKAGPGQDELKHELEKVSEDGRRLQRSASQLLEINRLKSEFIVNAGHELEASLQSVLGFAEQLGQGLYGQLTAEQTEAVKGIYAWSRRMKADIDWLIEYGSTRSRRLDAGEKEPGEKE